MPASIQALTWAMLQAGSLPPPFGMGLFPLAWLMVPYPSEGELVEIAKRTTGVKLPKVERVSTGETIVKLQKLAKQVPVSEPVYRYVARLVGASQPNKDGALEIVRRNIRVGASPRGVQAIIWGAKVEALLDDRKAVSIDDVRKVVYPALRHRLILNFEAQAEGVDPDSIVKELVSKVPVQR